MTRIIGIGGSARPESVTIQALRIALDGAKAAGGDVDVINVAEWKLPMFDGTYEIMGYPRADAIQIKRLLDCVDAAEGIILASPTYHSSISASIKNILELL